MWVSKPERWRGLLHQPIPLAFACLKPCDAAWLRRVVAKDVRGGRSQPIVAITRYFFAVHQSWTLVETEEAAPET